MNEVQLTMEISRWLAVVWPIWLMLAWLIGVVLTPYVARQKRYDPASWCVVAIVASPVIALLALAALPVRRDTTVLLADEGEEGEEGEERGRRRATYRPFSG